MSHAAGADRGPGGPADEPSASAATVLRSEEVLDVTRRRRPIARVRVRKVIVEEEVTLRLTLRREELRVDQSDILADDPGAPGEAGGLAPDVDQGRDDPGAPGEAGGLAPQSGWEPAGGDTTIELVLHEQVPEVVVRTVPRERVRVTTHVVTDDRAIDELVRRERVEIDADEAGRG